MDKSHNILDNPNFKKWFNGSKIVDKNGNPLIVYHGTDEDFSTFDFSKAGSRDTGYYGAGMYFTPNYVSAGHYPLVKNIEKNLDLPVDIDNLVMGHKPTYGKNIIPVYLRIINPFIINNSFTDFHKTMKSDKGLEITKKLKSKGYDGVIKLDRGLGVGGKGGEIVEIVAFYPNQIKSAIGNTGEFNVNDPNILKEVVEELVKETLFDPTINTGGINKVSQNFWLKPDGEFKKIPLQGHNTWASMYLSAFPDKYTEKLRAMNPQNVLYREGWIKVVLYDIWNDPVIRMEYYYENIPTQTQMLAIKKMVDEFNHNENHKEKITHIQDDTRRTRIQLQESIKKLDERMSFADLYDDTDDERIFKSKLPGMRVRPMAISMENGNETWNFGYTSQEKSEWERYREKVGHKGRIIFFKDSVEPDDNVEDLECMVDCDCRDFKYRFAYVDAQQDASMIGTDSLNKAINAPPLKTNPEGETKLCKHLAALIRYLVTNLEKARQRAHLRRRPFNIFEAMDELANKGSDKTVYYDKNDNLNENVNKIGSSPEEKYSDLPINWDEPDLPAGGKWNEYSIRQFIGLPQSFIAIYPAIIDVNELDARLGNYDIDSEENLNIDLDPHTNYEWDEFRMKKRGFPPIVVVREENGKIFLVDGSHRVYWAQQNNYRTIGAWVADKLIQKDIDKRRGLTLKETRIISPEESMHEGYITLYHGTIWPIALKAKKGELGPQNMEKLITDVLINVYHETPSSAKEIFDKYAVLRKKDPNFIFFTTNKKQAEKYAEACTKWGGEMFGDVIERYLWSKNKEEDRGVIFSKIQTREPAVVTVNVPLEMVLTHSHWSTPLRSKIRQIMKNMRNNPDLKDVLSTDFDIEVFVKENIPARFVQRIDKVYIK